MLDKWLRDERRETYSPMLEVRHVTADEAVEGDDLDDWLAYELMRNYFSPVKRQALVDTLRGLGVTELAEHVARTTLPGDATRFDKIVRTGEFGEALAGAMFRKLRRYCVPILKLRYKDRPGAPMQGPDLLAFRLSTTPPVIAVPEVKTQNAKRPEVGEKAAISLDGALESLDAGSEVVAVRLLEQGNALGTRVLWLLVDDSKVIERHVVVIHEDTTWDDRIVGRLGGAVTATTEATIVRVRQLKERIAATYIAAARAVHPDGRRAATSQPEEAPGA